MTIPVGLPQFVAPWQSQFSGVQLSVGVCSAGAVGARGFSISENIIQLQSPSGLQTGSGTAYYHTGTGYWTGASWNWFGVFGQRAGAASPLFRDLPGLSRLGIGACMWFDGRQLNCSACFTDFEYEAAGAKSGPLFVNVDFPGPYGANGYPTVNAITDISAYFTDCQVGCPGLPPVRTIDHGTYGYPYWQPNDLGTYTHKAPNDLFRDTTFIGVDGVAGVKYPYWFRQAWYPDPFSFGNYFEWASCFARFNVGPYPLLLFYLGM